MTRNSNNEVFVIVCFNSGYQRIECFMHFSCSIHHRQPRDDSPERVENNKESGFRRSVNVLRKPASDYM